MKCELLHRSFNFVSILSTPQWRAEKRSSLSAVGSRCYQHSRTSLPQGSVIMSLESISLMTQGSFEVRGLMTAPRESQRHPSCLFLITCHNGLSSFGKRTWLRVRFSYFHVCYLGVVHTLGLFGCATGKVALTGDPKMSLVFPPGGFRRCRVCTGVDSSKIPLPLPPVETITEQWATSNIPLLLPPRSLRQRLLS